VRSQKNFIVVIGVTAIYICVALLVWPHRHRGDSDNQRVLEADRVHDIDLPDLYSQLNAQYYGEQLPAHISVSWSPLVANKDCATCAGMTDWDTGFPRIRLDPTGVRSENFLREAMEHEMCHVATVDAATRAHQDFHGPLFQACMQRYVNPPVDTTAVRWPAR
jgi:hypothetical protein